MNIKKTNNFNENISSVGNKQGFLSFIYEFSLFDELNFYKNKRNFNNLKESEVIEYLLKSKKELNLKEQNIAKIINEYNKTNNVDSSQKITYNSLYVYDAKSVEEANSGLLKIKLSGKNNSIIKGIDLILEHDNLMPDFFIKPNYLESYLYDYFNHPLFEPDTHIKTYFELKKYFKEKNLFLPVQKDYYYSEARQIFDL